MKRQSSLRNNRGMATWLKVVLIAGAVCIIGIIGLVVAGGLFFQQFIAGMTSPEKIKLVASKFMTISDPLPAGYSYKAGAEVLDTPFVVVMTKDDKTVLTFFVPPATKNDSATAEGAIDGAAKGQSITTAPSAGPGAAAPKRLLKTTRGDMQVGKLKMPYVIGHAEKAADTNDTPNTFFGAVKSPTTGKIVYLMAQTIDPSPQPKPLTVETVKGLADAVQSFN